MIYHDSDPNLQVLFFNVVQKAHANHLAKMASDTWQQSERAGMEGLLSRNGITPSTPVDICL
jgi:hypothetical protein